MSQQYVEIELDGKSRLLRFDFNTVSELEERLGKGIIGVLTKEQVGFNMTRALYWAGMKWKDRGLTIERTGQLLQKEVENGKSLNDLMEPVVNALMKSGLLGKIDEEDDEQEDEDPNENPA
jgi:hypothetical protein